MFSLDSKINEQIPLERQWESFKNNCGIVSPTNKHQHKILVIGSGLAGTSAAATLAELGYGVQVFFLPAAPIASPPRGGLMQRRIIKMMAIVCGDYFTIR